MLTLILALSCTRPAPDTETERVDTEDTEATVETEAPDTDETGDTEDPGDTDTGEEDTGEEPLTVADLDPYVQPTDLWVTPADGGPGDTLTVHYCGRLGDEDDVRVRYGWDGWTVAGGQAPMYPEGADCRRGLVEAPADVEALHMVFSAGSDWDDRDGLDWHWALDFPYVGPYLTWDDGELVVHWETSVPCLGVVEHGTTDALGTLTPGEEMSRLHHVSLGEPEPGALHYRVHDSAGHASEVFEVSVPDPDTTSLEVAVTADMQHGGADERWPSVAATVLDTEPSLVLIAGDMAVYGSGGGFWWLFFDGGADLLARVPVAVAPGNHDAYGGLSHFLRWFDRDTPDDSLPLGPLHVLLLNSETPEEMEEGGITWTFAEADLAVADESLWTIALWHVPPYNAGESHWREQETVRELTSLLDGRVDWVFTGHEHLAQRFVPLRHDGEEAEAYGRGEDEGVGYTVLPPAGKFPNHDVVSEDSEGAAYRDLLAFPEVTPGETVVHSEYGYLLLSASPEELTMEIWGMGPVAGPVDLELLDQVTVRR